MPTSAANERQRYSGDAERRIYALDFVAFCALNKVTFGRNEPLVHHISFAATLATGDCDDTEAEYVDVGAKPMIIAHVENPDGVTIIDYVKACTRACAGADQAQLIVQVQQASAEDLRQQRGLQRVQHDS